MLVISIGLVALIINKSSKEVKVAHSFRAHLYLLPHRCLLESAAQTLVMTVTLGLRTQYQGITKPLPQTIIAKQDLTAKMLVFPKNLQEQLRYCYVTCFL